jgi:hypothetical protein
MKRSAAGILFVASAVVAGCAADRAVDDAEFSRRLWAALADARLVAEGSIRTRPYVGGDPHGAILEYLDRDLSVAGRTGRVLVKRNYAGPGATEAKVWADPAAFLAAVTVMFEREPGYDAANRDWFWAKYAPTGEVMEAGRVEACIACHRKAAAYGYILTFAGTR